MKMKKSKKLKYRASQYIASAKKGENITKISKVEKTTETVKKKEKKKLREESTNREIKIAFKVEHTGDMEEAQKKKFKITKESKKKKK